jgi:ClpP class serine protease
MLEKIPKNKDKIAVLINSTGGDYAQAHIMVKKIAQIAKRNNAQVWTFAQEWALNAGFLLLASGHRVFVNKASVVGGLEVGEAKFLRGKIGEYISTVTYAKQPSYVSEINRTEVFDPAKKEEVLEVNRRLAEDLEATIRQFRASQLRGEIDLNNFYLGEEAVKQGLADAVDTYHSAFGKLSLQNEVKVLEMNKWQRLIHTVRKCNFSD